MKKEKSLTSRPKLETDLSSYCFAHSWFLRDMNGNALKESRRKELWYAFKFSHPDLFIYVSTGGFRACILPQENIPALQEWLKKEKGILALPSRISQRNLLETDLSYTRFTRYWALKNLNNNNFMKPSDKTKLYNEFLNKYRQTLFVQIPTHGKTLFVLPKENIDVFKNWLLAEKAIKVMGVEPATRQKIDTDMTLSRLHSWCLKTSEGRSVRDETKSTLWHEFQNKNPDLFIRIGSRFVLPKENIETFKNWLKKEKGFAVFKLSPPQRQLLQTDLTANRFWRDWYLADQNGKAIWDYKLKTSLLKEFHSSAGQNLFIRVKGSHFYVLPEESIPLFQKWLKEEKGIVASKTKVLGTEIIKHADARLILKTDLTWHKFVNIVALKQTDGQIIKDSKQKSALFKEFKSLHKNLFIRVLSKRKQNSILVLPQENIPVFQRWLEKEKGILPVLRNQIESDITINHFLKNWRVIKKDGTSLSRKELKSLWLDAKLNTENIFLRVKNAEHKQYVLPQENLSALQDWLKKEKDLTLIDKEALILAKKSKFQAKKATKTKTKPEPKPKSAPKQKRLKSKNPSGARLLLETDTIKAQFVCFWKLKKDNSFLDHFKKASYWDALLKNKDQNILITAYNNGFKTVVLPQENIPAFREWLKTRSVMVVATQFNQQTNILPLTTKQRTD